LTNLFLQDCHDFKKSILANSIKLAHQALLNFCDCEIIKIGCELEFYLLDQDSNLAEEKIRDLFIIELKNNFYNLVNCQVKKEQGRSQVEIATFAFENLEKLSLTLDLIKDSIELLAKKLKLQISYHGLLSKEDCPSALQFNIAIYDSNHKNIFNKDQNLLNLFASLLLDFTDKMLYIHAPNEDDYFRFDDDINKKLFELGKYCAPINLSFGGDNRSCAIRIPACENKENLRIEYRIPSASANHWLSLSAILITLLQIKNQKNLYPKIYGNAFDEVYQLKKFAKNFQKSQENFFSEDNLVYNCFKEFITKDNNFK
jgi:glutamine synthetase